MAVSVITGHCTFGNHARRLGLPYNDFCRSCHSEEEEETVLHLIGTCRALMITVLNFFRGSSMTCLNCLRSVWALDSFVSSGWFEPTLFCAAALWLCLSHLTLFVGFPIFLFDSCSPYPFSFSVYHKGTEFDWTHVSCNSVFPFNTGPPN
ncbi:hypothetical protein EVAR_71480_1 [Eumeta japonica]|uniref:Reverse transcriptase zinc-binding domain-containing protein n=1 Tax=Eumeta variegata TaxID=151549 RepID=A0A4C1TA76_EUMVA|nr:hypothetical protein EVAR_71480_1 [Eumeta japonica]